MIKAAEIIRAGPGYLGTPYSQMDCQAFVEACLRDAGIRMNLAGSNAWYREVKRNGWVGTPAECIQKYGSIPRGAFLFIWKSDGKEPEKYRADGIGNASHIGIYTGMTGKEMCERSGKPDALRYNYGDGAINSSNTHGCVCTSKFAGKAISGGWNRIGIWNRIDYGTGGGSSGMEPYKATVINGSLNLRAAPAVKAGRVAYMPEGTVVTVLEENGEWNKVEYNGMSGYCMNQYLKKLDMGEMITIPRTQLQQVYKEIGELLEYTQPGKG